MFELIKNIIFPIKCPGCLKIIKDDSNFCQNCLQKIKIYNNLFCPKCYNRLTNINNKCHPQEKFILGAATEYNNITEQAIHLLKFQFASCVAKPISFILIKYFENILKYNNINISNFIVIPIPISKKRLKFRGFNQSEIIAEYFTKYFNLKLEKNILLRIKHSKSQSEIKNIEERKSNVLNCFEIKNKKYIQNKNIILIDDIITTGSTIKEAVKILKNNKVKKIIALTVCKA